jgi:hypothetical protein
MPLESIRFYVKLAKIGGKKFGGHYWLEEMYRYPVRAENKFSDPSLIIRQNKQNFT